MEVARGIATMED